MQLLFRVFLLALILQSCSAEAAAKECDLPPKLRQEVLHKVFESRWVLVEAFSDYPAGLRLVKHANSSLMEMKEAFNNETFLFIERNIVSGKCLVFQVNMSIPDPETSNHSMVLDSPGVMEFGGLVSPYNDQGRADVYQGCADCLTVVYSGVFQGIPGRLLLIYRKEGKHTDTDELKAGESIHRKLAECLKFNVETTFIYDGKIFVLKRRKKSETPEDDETSFSSES
ncbi:saxitoxin and tetrodotoxin-binding protein 2-like isoform X1 [Astatotilapia calliptera]|uniref:Lipocalin/cytosolic fatty-acid binding domain-containing protein n=1 Tax=Astatotilapia calliptera TaxID=8154 RepID=A0A3P8PBZ4_ASTCA|nr:saxitoxin and tetrodotoxin-binding protein 2-like isoform X1 [Astatotilapia calliptera]